MKTPKKPAEAYWLIMTLLFVFQSRFSVSTATTTMQVLGTLNDNSLRVTPLKLHGVETSILSHSFPSGGYNRSSTVPLSHTRRSIAGTSYEGILMEYTYIISYKNSTFQNFSLPCLSHELYEPVGLESSAVQILTCQDDSRVLVVSVDDQGIYTVKTRFESIYHTSSAAILTRDGTSTAVYIDLDNNVLLYYSLISGVETPYFTLYLDSCSGWTALSYSDTRVAFHCSSNNQLYIVTGSGNGQLFKPLITTKNVVLLRNRDLAASITNTGVEFFMNDFTSTSTILIPTQHIEYVIIDDIPCFFLFHESGMKVYYLNTSYPLNMDSLELIVDKGGGDPIDLGSFYIYHNPLPLFAYFSPPSTIRVVDYITNMSPYSAIHQSDSTPWLIDIWEEQLVISTTPTSSYTTTLTLSYTKNAITTSASSSSTVNSYSSVITTTNTTMVTSSPPPMATVQPSTKRNIIVGVVITIVAILLSIVVILFIIFIVYNKKKGRSLSLSFLPSIAGSSPSSSVPDITTTPNTIPVEATDCVYTQETGNGPDAQA